MKQILKLSKWQLLVCLGLLFVGLFALASLSPGAAAIGVWSMFLMVGNISFDQISSSIRKPGVYSEFNTKLASSTLPQARQRVLIIAQRIKALIEPAIFQEGTLNDMTSGGAFTGASVSKFRVKISTAGATDEFDWSDDDGTTWTTGVAITGAAQALSGGVTVTFGATTGHAVDDEWAFNAYPEPSAPEKTVKQIYSDAEASGYFGLGSLAHLMVTAAAKANAYLDLSIITLDDAGAGTAASGTLTITGPATAAGTLIIYIANRKLTVAVASADTADAIATAICNAIAAAPSIPVTASNNAGVVTLTAKNKGLCGNDIGIGYDLLNAAGVAVAVVDMSGGATNPTLQDALTIVYPEHYQIIVTPFNNQADLVTLRDHLDGVSGPQEKRRGIGIYGMNGALADATTLGGTQTNHGRVLCAYFRLSTTPRRSQPCEIAAAFAAEKASVDDPARPLDGREIKGISVPAIGDRLSRTEQETCLYNGVTPLETGPGEKVQIVRAVSTYVQNAQGVDDPSLLDITTITSLDYGVEAIEQMHSLRYSGAKKTARTKKMLKSDTLDTMFKLEALEIWENVDANKAGVLVEDDLQDATRVNMRIPVDVVNGLHVIANRIDLFL